MTFVIKFHHIKSFPGGYCHLKSQESNTKLLVKSQFFYITTPQNAGLVFGTLHGEHLFNEPDFLFVMFLLDLKQVAKKTLS